MASNNINAEKIRLRMSSPLSKIFYTYKIKSTRMKRGLQSVLTFPIRRKEGLDLWRVANGRNIGHGMTEPRPTSCVSEKCLNQIINGCSEVVSNDITKCTNQEDGYDHFLPPFCNSHGGSGCWATKIRVTDQERLFQTEFEDFP